MDAKEYATSLRLLADWYDAHPGMETPQSTFNVYATDTKENLAAAAKALGSCRKRFNDNVMYLERDFCGLRLSFVFLRNVACERRVVGTKVVPRQVIEEHEEEIVEWDCQPILAEPGELA